MHTMRASTNIKDIQPFQPPLFVLKGSPYMRLALYGELNAKSGSTWTVTLGADKTCRSKTGRAVTSFYPT